MATLPRPSLVHVARESWIPMPARVSIALGALRETARDGLRAFAVGVGLAVVGEIFEEEIAQVVGPRGKHDPRRQASRSSASPCRRPAHQARPPPWPEPWPELERQGLRSQGHLVPGVLVALRATVS